MKNKTQIEATTWVVVPAYNEERYLETVLAKLKLLTNHIIVVDDGSQDATTDIALTFTPHVLTHEVNLGKGAALKTGTEYAFNSLKAQAVVFLDSDDQHDTEELPLFYQALAEGSQVVFGERTMDSRMPLLRIMGNRLASLLVMIFFGTYIPDIPSGYKAIARSAYPILSWNATDYGVELEIAVRVAKNRLQFKTVQISTIYHDFNRGMTLIDAAKTIIQLISWRISL